MGISTGRVVAILFAAAVLRTGAVTAADPQPVKLFDGKTLNGWKGSDAEMKGWKADGGVLKFTGEGGETREGLLTDKQFGDGVLSAEFRVPKAGGVLLLFRMRAHYLGFEEFGRRKHLKESSVMLEISIDNNGDYNSMVYCSHPPKDGVAMFTGGPGMSNALNGRFSGKLKFGEWHKVRMVLRGNKFEFHLNGKLEFDVEKPGFGNLLPQGRVGLFSSGGTEFRDIALLPAK